ncbi:MAG: hypothetical protein AAF702_23485 [Chloroflexota bacterium]
MNNQNSTMKFLGPLIGAIVFVYVFSLAINQFNSGIAPDSELVAELSAAESSPSDGSMEGEETDNDEAEVEGNTEATTETAEEATAETTETASDNEEESDGEETAEEVAEETSEDSSEEASTDGDEDSDTADTETAADEAEADEAETTETEAAEIAEDDSDSDSEGEESATTESEESAATEGESESTEAESSGEVAQTLEIQAGDLFFGESGTNNLVDPPVWTVGSGQEIGLVINNIGSVDHNWAILKKDAEAPVPFLEAEHADLLYFNPGLQEAGTQVETTFTAPEELGEYMVICTAPGHYPVMQGRLVVEGADGDDAGDTDSTEADMTDAQTTEPAEESSDAESESEETTEAESEDASAAETEDGSAEETSAEATDAEDAGDATEAADEAPADNSESGDVETTETEAVETESTETETAETEADDSGSDSEGEESATADSEEPATTEGESESTETESSGDVAQTLEIQAGDLFFGESGTNNLVDPPVWTVGSGQEIGLVINNIGSVDHNWAILKKDVEAPIPFLEADHADLLYFNPGLQEAGTQVETTFTAPEELGEYMVICTAPGHYPVMQGRLVVEGADGDDAGDTESSQAETTESAEESSDAESESEETTETESEDASAVDAEDGSAEETSEETADEEDAGDATEAADEAPADNSQSSDVEPTETGATETEAAETEADDSGSDSEGEESATADSEEPATTEGESESADAESSGDVAQTIEIQAGDLFFGESGTNNLVDPPIWTVGSGQEIGLVVNNIGSVDHNWAILKKDAEAPIPFLEADHADLLYFNPGLQEAGTQIETTFTAPEELGEYMVICTAPGHYPVMQGRLVVE